MVHLKIVPNRKINYTEFVFASCRCAHRQFFYDDEHDVTINTQLDIKFIPTQDTYYNGEVDDN